MTVQTGCGLALSTFLAILVGCSSSTPTTALPPAPVAYAPQRFVAPAPLPSVPRAVSPAAGASQTHPIYAMPLTANPTRDLRVMSFNLRVATAFDLLNTWDFRRGMVVERIRSFDPDLLGTQEGLASMEDFLSKKLTDYTFFGVGRNDGKRRGEMVGVFYKTNRFTQLDGGHFWLSQHPEKPGSHGWGAWFPRMVTWVKLQPTDGAQPFYWFNTHFDAFASRARTESAKLLLDRMNTIAGASPNVVTGDFNADAGSTPYQLLTTAQSSAGSPLADAFRVANPVRTRQEGTRHDFNGHKGGSRIDWILASPSFQAISADIDRTRGFLGYPSDHFPMTATLRPLPAPLVAPRVAQGG